jgi:hypothetical protein
MVSDITTRNRKSASKSITLSKWYPCKINSYYDLINRCEVSVSQKTTDIIRLSYSQSGPAIIHDQKKKDKRTNNDLQNITQKTKDRATRNTTTIRG